MILAELLKAIQPLQVIGNKEVEITDVNIDSRKVGQGHLQCHLQQRDARHRARRHLHTPLPAQRRSSPRLSCCHCQTP